MKVAVLSESSADEAAVRVFVDGLLGMRTEEASLPTIRARGWNAVLAMVQPVLKHLYYRTDAQGLVITLDSDLTSLHRDEEKTTCRLCQLRRVIAETMQNLTQMPQREPVKTACGVAVPAIETWYLVGRNPHVGEADWLVSVQADRYHHRRRELKKSVYGTEIPSLETETTLAVQHVSRLVRESQLGLLEQLFPAGFGALASDLRSW